jgi:hypothetical protein
MDRLLVLLSSIALAACGSAEAEPAPDPKKLEMFLASLEEEPAPAVEDKVRDADRLLGTVQKIDPERIDPDIARSLLR